MNELSNKKIKFVMDMPKKVQSEDFRKQNTLVCFFVSVQFISNFLADKG